MGLNVLECRAEILGQNCNSMGLLFCILLYVRLMVWSERNIMIISRHRPVPVYYLFSKICLTCSGFREIIKKSRKIWSIEEFETLAAGTKPRTSTRTSRYQSPSRKWKRWSIYIDIGRENITSQSTTGSVSMAIFELIDRKYRMRGAWAFSIARS